MKQILITIAAVVLVGCGPSASERALLEAASAGHIEAVKQHLADGADVNAKGKYGGTPLHEAALNGQKETIEILIAKGADVNAKMNNGETLLDWAESVLDWELPETKAAKKEIADLLRKHGGKTGEELKAEGK